MSREYIYPEMMVHIPTCTHKEPQNALIISDDASKLIEEFSRHKEVSVKVISASNALVALRDEADATYDIVICEDSSDAALLAHVSRVSKEDALAVLDHPSLDNVEENKALMQILGNYYKIIMPYNVGEKTALFVSKEYHPTADINLHRTDMLDGQSYYNCDVHPACFATGNDIRKTYLGAIRN